MSDPIVLDGLDDSYFDRPEVLALHEGPIFRSAYAPGGWMRARPLAPLIHIIEQATGLSLLESYRPTLHSTFVQFATGGALTSDDLRRLLDVRFSYEGRTFVFSEITPSYGDVSESYIEISFQPQREA